MNQTVVGKQHAHVIIEHRLVIDEHLVKSAHLNEPLLAFFLIVQVKVRFRIIVIRRPAAREKEMFRKLAAILY
ncbi:hypothetical protein D3C84_925710 [compost metagenome]